MSKPLVEFLQRWGTTTAGVLIAANIVSGVDYHGSLITLLTASLLLGFFNATIRPLLILLSIPLFCLSMGLFVFALPAINALLLLAVGKLVKGFTVTGFWPAVWASLIISLVSFFANSLLGKRRPPSAGSGPSSPSAGPRPGNDQGPIIDV